MTCTCPKNRRTSRHRRSVGRGVVSLIVASILAGAACASATARTAGADGDHVLAVMQDELQRNQRGLVMDGYPAPYFLAFTHYETRRARVAAALGATVDDDTDRRSLVAVEVRVGSHELDNSEYTDPLVETLDRYEPSPEAPVDGNAVALAHAFWRLADFRYKEALVAFSHVKGKRAFETTTTERSASFSHEDPQRKLAPVATLDFDHARWRRDAEALSKRFLAHPDIFDSLVEVKAGSVLRRMVNTEGTVLRTMDRYYSLHATAYARAPDGMLLDHSVDIYWRSPEQAPDMATATAKVDEMIGELLELREAPVLEPYTGPAILAEQATGVFFHEVIGHRLEGHRLSGDEEGQTFKGRVGKYVLPEFLSIIDDPSLAEFDGVPLNGYYAFDDEGVPGRRAELVEEGILRGFLLSRNPVEGFPHSNGHGRASVGQRPVARMGNFIVRGEDGVSGAELKARLLAEVRRQKKPFGLIIRNIAGGSTNTAAYGYQAFKGTPRIVYKVDAATGAETLVRGVEFVGTPLTSVNRIVAVGSEYGVFNGYCGAESGFVPVAMVAPATLFQEVELQRTHRPREKPQLLPPPATEGEEQR